MTVRRKVEIEAAMRETEDRLWYDRSHGLDHEGDSDNVVLRVMARRESVERMYNEDLLGPMTPFELGRLQGKYSALKWVLGGDWDVLDS